MQFADVIKFSLGVLCIVTAVPYGYSLRPRIENRQPGDMLTTVYEIGALACLIGLGISLIAWAYVAQP